MENFMSKLRHYTTIFLVTHILNTFCMDAPTSDKILPQMTAAHKNEEAPLQITIDCKDEKWKLPLLYEDLRTQMGLPPENQHDKSNKVVPTSTFLSKRFKRPRRCIEYAKTSDQGATAVTIHFYNKNKKIVSAALKYFMAAPTPISRNVGDAIESLEPDAKDKKIKAAIILHFLGKTCGLLLPFEIPCPENPDKYIPTIERLSRYTRLRKIIKNKLRNGKLVNEYIRIKIPFEEKIFAAAIDPYKNVAARYNPNSDLSTPIPQKALEALEWLGVSDSYLNEVKDVMASPQITIACTDRKWKLPFLARHFLIQTEKNKLDMYDEYHDKEISTSEYLAQQYKIFRDISPYCNEKKEVTIQLPFEWKTFATAAHHTWLYPTSPIFLKVIEAAKVLGNPKKVSSLAKFYVEQFTKQFSVGEYDLENKLRKLDRSFKENVAILHLIKAPMLKAIKDETGGFIFLRRLIGSHRKMWNTSSTRVLLQKKNKSFLLDPKSGKVIKKFLSNTEQRWSYVGLNGKHLLLSYPSQSKPAELKQEVINFSTGQSIISITQLTRNNNLEIILQNPINIFHFKNSKIWINPTLKYCLQQEKTSNTVNLLNLKKGDTIKEYPDISISEMDHDNIFENKSIINWSYSGELICIKNGTTYSVIDCKTGNMKKYDNIRVISWDYNEEKVWLLRKNPNNTETLLLEDRKTGKEYAVFEEIDLIMVGPSNKYLYLRFTDNSSSLLNNKTGKIIKSYTNIKQADVSPSGKLFLISDEDRNVFVCDCKTGKQVKITQAPVLKAPSFKEFDFPLPNLELPIKFYNESSIFAGGPIVDITTKKTFKTPPTENCIGGDFSPDGNIFLGDDGCLFEKKNEQLGPYQILVLQLLRLMKNKKFDFTDYPTLFKFYQSLPENEKQKYADRVVPPFDFSNFSQLFEITDPAKE